MFLELSLVDDSAAVRARNLAEIRAQLGFCKFISGNWRIRGD